MFSEEAARQVLAAGDRANTIVGIIDAAWDAHLEENRARRRRTRANVVWDYMVDFADRELAPLDGVHRYERYGIPMWVFDERMVLRFKKHDPKLLATRNVETGHQRRIAEQGHLDGMPHLLHVTCGYVLDAAEAGIEKIVVVRRVAGMREWWIDMRELASGVLAPATPMLPELDSAGGAPLPGIVPARREEDGEGE